MKKTVILIIMGLFISGCGQVQGREVFTCEYEHYFGETTKIPMKSVYIGEDDYITSQHITGRIENPNSFRLSSLPDALRYSMQLEENPHLEDHGDYILIDHLIVNEDRPKGWRGFLIPAGKRLSEIKKDMERYGGCES